MARTNYSFEKRQRELAKKRKKEEKAAKKAAGGGEEEMTPNDAALALAAQGGEAGEGDETQGVAAPADRPDDDAAAPAAGAAR